MASTTSDPGTQTGHRHALFGAAGEIDTGSRGRQCSLGSCRGSNWPSRGSSFRLGRNGIFLRHATTTAGTGDVSGSDTLLIKDLAGGRAGCAGRGSRSSDRGRCGSCFRGLRRRSCNAGGGFGIDTGDQFTGDNGITVAFDDFNQDTRTRRRDFKDDFIRFDVDQDFVARDAVANFLFPGGQRAFGDGFGQLGNLNFNNAHNDSTLL